MKAGRGWRRPVQTTLSRVEVEEDPRFVRAAADVVLELSPSLTYQ
jgi:hypothetical protein